jgi:beta-lactamase regulating signal transducer with metallopeptidase domain
VNTALWWYLQTAVTAACLVPFVVLACRLFRNRPAVQHALWLIVLIKLLTPSFVVWPWDLSDLQRSVFSSADTAETPLTLLPDKLPEPGLETLPLASIIVAVFLMTWIIGACVVAARQYRRLRSQAQLVKGGTTAPFELVDAVRTVAVRWQLGYVPVLMVRGIASPFVWCLGRLKLVWPQQPLPTGTAPPAIIAHELAHVVRRDHWVAWLELAASVLWWWNPVFWMVRRNLRSTSEMACDALALSAFPDDRCAYAETLLELSASSTNGVPALVLGVGTGTPSSLERRMSMIVSTTASGKLSRTGILLAALLAFIALPGWSYGQPDDDDDDDLPKKRQLLRKMITVADAA